MPTDVHFSERSQNQHKDQWLLLKVQVSQAESIRVMAADSLPIRDKSCGLAFMSRMLDLLHLSTESRVADFSVGRQLLGYLLK